MDRIELWLKEWLRYPTIWSLLVVICFAAAWFLDRTLLRVPQNFQTPKIEVYNTPAEKLDASVRSYFQFPAYKELVMNYGSSLKFNKFYTVTSKKIDSDSYLMLQIDGEQEERAFNLSKAPVLPFTIEINNKGLRSLLTIEQIKESGVQVRTFLAIQ